MARRPITLLLALACAALEVALLFSAPAAPPARRAPRLALSPPPPLPSPPPRELPEEGTLTAPCARNSAYIDARLQWLWREAQSGAVWAEQCCACLDCVGGDSLDAPTCGSQFGQDLFLYRNFFRCLPSPGAYVDVGAHHPRELSSTYMLDACLGWRQGLCVEANAYYAGLIGSARTCRVAHAAAGPKEGFVFLRAAGARSEAESAAAAPESGAVGEYVRSATLTTLLAEANWTVNDGRTADMTIIDLLSVDVEGGELGALIGLPWDNVWPRIIMVENVRGSQDVFEFLMDRGYAKFATVAVDDFYYRVSGTRLRQPKELQHHRQTTARMRRAEMGVETYENKVLYDRKWDHIHIMWRSTGDIPTD